MSKEAMKLALESLKFAQNGEVGWTLFVENAILALEETLAKQEQGEPVAPNHSNNSQNSFETRMNVGFDGGAQKQEQGEPDVSNKLKFDCEFVDGTVADLTVYGSERDIKRLEARIKFWWNLEQHSGTPDSDKGERIIWGKPPQPKQEQGEPVAHTAVFNCPNCKYPHRVFTHITGAAQFPWEVTTPQQRKPLTEEQLIDLWPSLIMHQHTYAFARAIEAAHGIKE